MLPRTAVAVERWQPCAAPREGTQAAAAESLRSTWSRKGGRRSGGAGGGLSSTSLTGSAQQQQQQQLCWVKRALSVDQAVQAGTAGRGRTKEMMQPDPLCLHISSLWVGQVAGCERVTEFFGALWRPGWLTCPATGLATVVLLTLSLHHY